VAWPDSQFGFIGKNLKNLGSQFAPGLGYPWVELLGIEPGRPYSEYSFLCVPEVVDDVQGATVDFILMISCLSSKTSQRYKTSTLVFTNGSKSTNGTGFGVYVPGVQWSSIACITFKCI
jgi:hypothetical protein